VVARHGTFMLSIAWPKGSLAIDSKPVNLNHHFEFQVLKLEARKCLRGEDGDGVLGPYPSHRSLRL